MLRLKVYQRTSLEAVPPPARYFEMNEEDFTGNLFLVPGAAAARGVQFLLATEGPDAPLPPDVDVEGIRIRQIVCTQPDIAGEVVIEFPHLGGYLSD